MGKVHGATIAGIASDHIRIARLLGRPIEENPCLNVIGNTASLAEGTVIYIRVYEILPVQMGLVHGAVNLLFDVDGWTSAASFPVYVPVLHGAGACEPR